MVMGNCFSPVMEGSQFKWNNDLPRYIFYIDSEHEELYSYKDGVLESNVTIMDPVDNYFYNYIDIQIRNFNDNPIPDFYVGVVDKVGD